MYNPEDYREKKMAVKRLTGIVAGLTVALVAVVCVTALSIGQAQRDTRIISEYKQKLSAADSEIAHLNQVIVELNENEDEEGD